MEFTLTHPDIGTKSILVLFDGVPYEADSNHPWWEEIVDLVLEDDPRVLDLFPIRPVQQPSELIEDDFPIFDDTCNDPDCQQCYPRSNIESEPQDDLTQLHAEVDWAWTEYWDLADKYGATVDELNEAVEKIDFLESGLEHYANHAYADLQRVLDERWPG